MPRSRMRFGEFVTMLLIAVLSAVSDVRAQTINGHDRIQLGEVGPHVSTLRCLLEQAGYKANKETAPDRFDPPLAWPIKQFQKSQGLKVVGNAGPKTLAALTRNTAWAAACGLIETSAEVQTPVIAPAERTESETPKDQPVVEYDLFALQVLLDRLGFSPGELDGADGSNLAKARKAFEDLRGKAAFPSTQEALDAMLKDTGGPALMEHTLTASDVEGPFGRIPASVEEQAKMRSMPYRSVLEKLGELYHISPVRLKKINPEARFVEGETIRVPAVGSRPKCDGEVRVRVEKSARVMRVLCDEQQIAFYPVTINTGKTPKNVFLIERINRNPTYVYRSSLFIKHAKADERFILPPGPNGPVGDIWILINRKRGIGIHGTPLPGRISKAESHGCIRLTNWDAREVAAMVKVGTAVEIVD